MPPSFHFHDYTIKLLRLIGRSVRDIFLQFRFCPSLFSSVFSIYSPFTDYSFLFADVLKIPISPVAIQIVGHLNCTMHMQAEMTTFDI